MINFISVLLTAISLSMDAFSLSVLYGTLNLDKRKTLTLSLTVGVFHFFMPLIGHFIGISILTFLPVNPNILVGLIFFVIAIQMFCSTFKTEELVDLKSLIAIIVFAFTVSIDSFSIGIGLSAISNSKILSVSIFSLTSFTFTYIGLTLGGRLNKYFESVSTIIGSIILLALSIMYLFFYNA